MKETEIFLSGKPAGLSTPGPNPFNPLMWLRVAGEGGSRPALLSWNIVRLLLGYYKVLLRAEGEKVRYDCSTMSPSALI